MKKENTKNPKKGNPVEEDHWIDVHDDDVVRAYGIWRPYNQAMRDPSVWTKTPNERRLLKRLRKSFKGRIHFHTIPKKHIRLYDKLIINLYKNKKFNKTTYSTKCWQHEIPEVLARYRVEDPKTGFSTSVVRKYIWNGKAYNPDDLPFAW